MRTSWPLGRARLPCRSRACPPPRRCCWRCSSAPASVVHSTIPPPSRSTDALPKRRPNGRRATAARSRIRPAAPADVDDVAVIERAVFSDPWSRGDFAECVTSGVPFLVAEAGGLVEGYSVAPCAADQGEILNLGVAGAHLRRRVGPGPVEHVVAALAAPRGRGGYLHAP